MCDDFGDATRQRLRLVNHAEVVIAQANLEEQNTCKIYKTVN
jgi:hypothetical protein